MQLRVLALLWVAVSCGSCGWSSGRSAANDASQAHQTAVPALIARRGEERSLGDALAGIGFTPFIPRHVVVVTAALLPPFTGDDVRKNRGIGIEYESAGGLYALSQWPSHGVSPEGATPVGTEAGCPISMFRRAGFLWQSATRISTLQPDGDAAPSSVLHEARRIIREGACRDRR